MRFEGAYYMPKGGRYIEDMMVVFGIDTALILKFPEMKIMYKWKNLGIHDGLRSLSFMFVPYNYPYVVMGYSMGEVKVYKAFGDLGWAIDLTGHQSEIISIV